LTRTTIVLPDAAARDRVGAQAAQAGFPAESLPDGSLALADPSGNPVALTAAA
jgi:hypothetical protein